MKKVIIALTLLSIVKITSAQVRNTDTLTNAPMNSGQNIIAGNGDQKVSIGAYAQIDYNQGFNDSTRTNGNLDVHRLVLFLGYKFNDRAQFVTEIEMEHHVELEVEQAFLNYRVLKNNQFLNFRAGLMIVPMGIINEYHEPVTFNGVERPLVDTKIIPTTWREIGAGFFGSFDKLSLRYQAYLVNGFQSYDGTEGLLNGTKGFKEGRQEAGENTINSPGVSGKVDFYGIRGLKLGLAGYNGKTQSTLYDGLSKKDTLANAMADSSIIGVSAFGFDARYNYKNFEARGELLYVANSNTNKYNKFTGNDIGSVMMGYYAEVGYNLLGFLKTTEEKLILFGRYEFYDTNYKVKGDLEKNDAYAVRVITTGLTYKVSNGAAFKADYQIFETNEKDSPKANQLNLGIGIWF